MAAGAMVSWQNIGAESKISLNSADTAEFIRLYQEEELLWNVNLTDHTNKHKRVESLQRISKKLGKNWSTEQVRDKIMSLRSRYSKEIVKVRVSIASGADPSYQPVWQYFPLLDCFLRPFSVTRKTDTPVVRAFHKRLMEGGVPANQPSTPTMTYPTPPHDVSATTTPHFFQSPQPADPQTANPYQRSQQNILPPPAELDYKDDDEDDDDVQIVEEDVSKVMEEVAMLIENQAEDDRDSGYNGGFREGGFGSDSAVESDPSGRTCSREEGSWINSPFVGSDLAHAEGASGEEGSLLSETAEEFSSQPDQQHGDSLHDGGAGPGVTQVGRQQAQSPLNHKRQLLNTDHVVAIGGPNQNVSRLPHPKESSKSDAGVRKLERPAALQSPPPPPLPRRRSLTDVSGEDSPAFVNSEGSRTGILQGHRASIHDSSVCDSGQRTKRRQSFAGEGRRRGSEPFPKRIKQEKDSGVSAECTYGEVSTPDLQSDTAQRELTSSPGFSPAGRGRVGIDLISPRSTLDRRSNPAHQNPRELSSPPTSSSSHRNTPRMAGNLSACSVVSPSCDSSVNRVRDAASPTASDRSSAVSIVSQVTDGVSRQITSLLQTLVSNLTDSASGGVSADTNMAFADYIKAELTKLDEDLQADAKFSIQKIIYEAQKEMSQRRTSNENNVE